MPLFVVIFNRLSKEEEDVRLYVCSFILCMFTDYSVNYEPILKIIFLIERYTHSSMSPPGSDGGGGDLMEIEGTPQIL